MKSRTTLILALLALVVGGIVLLDYKKGTTTDDAQTRSKKLLDLKAADVTGFDLVRTNQTISLEKVGDRWELKQPLAVRANASAAGALVDALEFADRVRTLSAEEIGAAKLAGFGLEKPRLRVTLRRKAGPLTVLVGNMTPTKDALYVQIDGHPDIFLTGKTLEDQLNKTLDDLRDRTIVEFVPSAATRLEIKSPQRTIELVKSAATTNAEPRWAIIKPLAMRAEQQKVSDLLGELENLRVTDFVSDDSKDVHTYHLDEPDREITVFTGDAGKTLLVGPAPTNDAAKVYAKLKSTDAIVTVPADTLKKFAVQVNDIRDHRVLAFQQLDVRGIEIVRGDRKIVLAGADKTWKIIAPLAVAAEDSKVNGLLQGLSELTATQFTADVATDLDKYGLTTPQTTITMLGNGTNIVTQLLIGGLGDSNTVRFVKRADEPFIYGIEAAALDWLPAEAVALRTRRLAELKAEQITKLTVENAGAKFVLERGPDTKWKLIEPAQGVLDNDTLQQLLTVFAQLRAVDIIRAGADNLAEFGLDNPTLTITATVADKTYKLTVGKPQSPDAKYAAWNDPALIFTADNNDLAALTRNLLPPPKPPAPPSVALPPAPAK